MKKSILIIGAGASGLMAGYELTKAGFETKIVEARNRIGGRIFDSQPQGFEKSIALGAEFIHGDLSITKSLLKKAGGAIQTVTGFNYNFTNGQLVKGDFFDKDWNVLLKTMKKLEVDKTFQQFFEENFSLTKDAALYDKAKRFIQGYNAADVDLVSTFSLRDEWLSNSDEQSRPKDGYYILTDYLTKEIIASGGLIVLDNPVTEISWSKDKVVTQTNHNTFESDHVIVTIPPHLLHTITFLPQIPNYVEACNHFPCGNVIKFHFEFTDVFWKNTSKQIAPRMQFIFSDLRIPTWWSQLPEERPILTGWIGGPAATNLSHTHTNLEALALETLASIFQLNEKQIKDSVKAFHIVDWLKDNYSRGAYSFETLQSRTARQVIQQPLAGKIFFAGEALCSSQPTGTVESALQSGKEAASKIRSA